MRDGLAGNQQIKLNQEILQPALYIDFISSDSYLITNINKIILLIIFTTLHEQLFWKYIG